MKNSQRRPGQVPVPSPRFPAPDPQLVGHERRVKTLVLGQFRPVVLLGPAPVLPRGQPHLEPDPALDGAALRAGLQLEPALQTGAGDVLQRNSHAAQEVVLGTLAGRLADLLEEATQSADPSDLVQFADRLQDGALVVVVPDVQVQGVAVDVVDVAGK